MNPPLEIPEDLLVEILKRLPAKSIVRFRCVSKSWSSLLAGPAFIGAHLCRARDATRLGLASSVILSRYGDSLLAMDPQSEGPQIAVELDFPMLPYFPYYVKGHCDGLICCVVNDGSHGFLLLYNPSINVYRKMPIPPNFRSTREVFGLGFDESTDDYKIVRLPSMYCKLKVPGFVPKIEVFSLRANSWRKLPDEDTPPFFVEHVFQATNANGGIYWLAEDGDTMRCVILRFDLATEKFSVVPTPKDEADRNVSWIGALRDELCMVHTQRLSSVDVWATGDDRNWRKVISVPRSQGPGPSVYSSRYTPLCFTEHGELVMTVGGEGFVGFDPESKRFRNLEVDGAEHYLQETVICESLVSPYMGKRKELVDDEAWLANTTSNSGIKQLILGLRRGFSSKSGWGKQR